MQRLLLERLLSLRPLCWCRVNSAAIVVLVLVVVRACGYGGAWFTRGGTTTGRGLTVVKDPHDAGGPGHLPVVTTGCCSVGAGPSETWRKSVSQRL